MSISHNLAALQHVVDIEIARKEARKKALKVLDQKIRNFADNKGDPPTDEELREWRESVAIVNFEKTIDSGFDEL